MAKRDYKNNYPSVTQVLGILRKIGLENWFKYNTADFCNKKSSLGKKIGGEIHEAIESFIITGEAKIETEHAEEVSTALKSFVLFKKEHPEIRLEVAELVLCSEKYGYNGTFDCRGNDGEPVIFDWKSGECKKKDEPVIYDEAIYQVSAYVRAYNEQEHADIKKAYIVSPAKDKVAYAIRVLEAEEIDQAFNEVFLPALKIYNYQKKK